jgi:Xaa-Pro aminopeptidase
LQNIGHSIFSKGFKSIPHSLGHGIGLEVHEKPHLSPASGEKLSLNSVFSIEPGIYLPSFGGVRIEDLGVLTSKGFLLISHAEKEIIEV